MAKIFFTILNHLRSDLLLLLLFPALVNKAPFGSRVKWQRPPQMVWDGSSLTRISPPDSSGGYARMIRLKNGALLTAYAANGAVVCAKSTDGGRRWSLPAVIARRRDAVNMDTPDLVQLQNGTVMVCYATRPQGALRGRPDTARKFEIRIQRSNDDGKTWGDEKVLYRAGASFNDGCWEPSAVQLPSGEVQLFFSDEGVYTASAEQNISMLRSVDNGATWTATPQIISFRQGSRDGMPVAVWLQKTKRVAVAIEDPGYKNFKPYTIQSSTGGQWVGVIDGGNTNRFSALAVPIADSVYAGAPYLRQLSTGETVLSYQSTEGRLRNRDNDAVMRVAIGDKEAKNFVPVADPFTVPEGFHALWNSLCVTEGDTVIAVTSTNAFSKSRSEVWMIKGLAKKNEAVLR